MLKNVKMRLVFSLIFLFKFFENVVQNYYKIKINLCCDFCKKSNTKNKQFPCVLFCCKCVRL